MQIGFNLPISGKLSDPATVTRIAREGEAMGYDYLTLTDHIVLPNLKVPGYPYSESGEFFGDGPERRHDQLTAAAYIAAKTQRIRLVLAVMVVPYRPAVLAAKMLATIDVLSGGRLTVGIGAGWLEAEFDAVAVTPFAKRGAVTDEYIRAFRTLWTEEAPRLGGDWVKFDEVRFEPKPVQKPHPPIWVGGESGPALRRAARLGDAWYPIGSNNRHLLDTLPRYRAGIDRLRKFTAEAGRDPADGRLDLSDQTLWRGGAGHGLGRRAPAVFRRHRGHRRRFAGAAGTWRQRRRHRFRAPRSRRFARRNAPVQGRRDQPALGRELLRHAKAGVAGRVAVDAAEHLPALALVEAGRLEREREQDGMAAAAFRPFGFGRLDDPAAEPLLAQAFGQEKPVDIHQPERGPADQPADDLAAVGVGNQNRERPLVAIAGLFEIVGAKPVADHRLGRRAGHIGHRHGQRRHIGRRRHQPVSIGNAGSIAHSPSEAS